MTKRLIYILIAMLASIAAEAAPKGYFVRGVVRDSITNETLPYITVQVAGHKIGTLSDSRGIFEITLPDTLCTVTFTGQGYAPTTVAMRKNRVNLYNVLMAPQAQMLGEFVVKKKKYSKKNNPAVDLMQRIRTTSEVNDPRRNPYYNYRVYERTTLALNDFTNESKASGLMKKFPFLWEHVDTSEVSGKPILNLSVKEKSADVHWRKSTHSAREIITGIKSDGIDEITDQASMRTFLEDVLREIDLYDRDINLLQNRFVSPLSPIAADFYKFYITDSIVTDSTRTLVLSFYPHNKSAFGFTGQMYVQPSDSDMFISKVNMRVPSEINLNFIDNMYINQEFVRAPDGSRLKVRDDLTLEVSVLPGASGLYVRRNVAYADHNFEVPTDENQIFKAQTAQVVERDAESRDDVFWEGVRLIEMPKGERSIASLMQRLRSVPLYYWGEKCVKVLSSGYIPTAKKHSPFDFGPLNTFVTGNTLEGLRLSVGGMTMADFSPHWFSRFYGAYGFKDHKWKYGLELEYSFNEKKLHSREFPMHALRFNSSYDKDQLGQHYLFTSPDNVFLALKRQDDNRVTYLRHNALTYILELQNNFSVTATIANDRQISSRLLNFSLSDGTPLWSFDESYGEITLRYAPGEKFYQTRSYRFPINLDAPVVQLSHRLAVKGIGTRWAVSRTELSVQKRFWFSAWGYLDGILAGGHVWSRRTPFTQMFIPNANLSYIIEPESYALMNPMEFVSDSYASAFVTYYANGAILNYVPIIKKLKLREVFSCRAYWGRLSDANNPRIHDDMLAFPVGDVNDVAVTDVSHTPYVEASVGIENILKCLRIDWVWRITHRYPGYPVDRQGPRIAFHLTF